MSPVADSVPTDRWLVPVLRELLPAGSLKVVESAGGPSYWRAAVDKALLTDDQVLEALSTRTRFRIATDLLVSSQARDRVSERLARRFGILPLAISESTLEIATSNPYDLDCEKTLAFATGRTVQDVAPLPRQPGSPNGLRRCARRSGEQTAGQSSQVFSSTGAGKG